MANFFIGYSFHRNSCRLQIISAEMFFFICHLFIIGYFLLANFIGQFFIGISFHRNSCRLQIISAEMCGTWILFRQTSFPVSPNMNVCILGSLFSKTYIGGLDFDRDNAMKPKKMCPRISLLSTPKSLMGQNAVFAHTENCF